MSRGVGKFGKMQQIYPFHQRKTGKSDDAQQSLTAVELLGYFSGGALFYAVLYGIQLCG